MVSHSVPVDDLLSRRHRQKRAGRRTQSQQLATLHVVKLRRFPAAAGGCGLANTDIDQQVIELLQRDSQHPGELGTYPRLWPTASTFPPHHGRTIDIELVGKRLLAESERL